MDTVWPQSNFPAQPQPQAQQQWIGNQGGVPTSLWDLHAPPQIVPPTVPTPNSATSIPQPAQAPPTSIAQMHAHAQETAAKEREKENSQRLFL